MAGRANGGESRLGGEACAGRDVKNAHARFNLSRAQKEGHEVSGDVRKGTIIFRRRFRSKGKLFGHLDFSMDAASNIAIAPIRQPPSMVSTEATLNLPSRN
jgi:hypothetical protein